MHHLNSYNNGHYIQCMHYCTLSVVILFALACSQWRFFSVSYKRQATPPRSPEQPHQQHHHREERSQDAQQIHYSCIYTLGLECNSQIQIQSFYSHFTLLLCNYSGKYIFDFDYCNREKAT